MRDAGSGEADLRLVEGFLVNFLSKGFGYGFPLENVVLTEEKPVLEREFSEREADYELLPGKEWAVEPASQALFSVRMGMEHRVARKHT